MIDEELLMLNVGKLDHSRWNTTANRFLRLYLSKHGLKGKDLKNLNEIVEFMVNHYYPM